MLEENKENTTNNNDSLYVEKVNYDIPLAHLSEEEIDEKYSVYVKVRSLDGEKQYVLKDKKEITLGNHPDDDIYLSNDSSFASHLSLNLKNKQFIVSSLPSKTKIIHQDENSIQLFIGFNEVLLNLNKPENIAEKKSLEDIKPEVYQLLAQTISPKKYLWQKIKLVSLLFVFFLPNIFFYFMNSDHEISELDSLYNSGSTSIDFFLVALFYLATFINYKKHNIFGLSYKYWKLKLFNKFLFLIILLSLISYFVSNKFADETSFIYNLGTFFLSFMLMENWFQISIFNKKTKFALRVVSFLLLLGWFIIKMSIGIGGYIML